MKIVAEKTRENSQVALIAWAGGHGFAGEPLDYVAEVHYFDSKKQANEFQVEDWKARGCPMEPDFNRIGQFIGEVPDYRFMRVQRGTKSWKYAYKGYIEEMSREELLAWIA